MPPPGLIIVISQLETAYFLKFSFRLVENTLSGRNQQISHYLKAVLHLISVQACVQLLVDLLLIVESRAPDVSYTFMNLHT